jgi:hypothetical protein
MIDCQRCHQRAISPVQAPPERTEGGIRRCRRHGTGSNTSWRTAQRDANSGFRAAGGGVSTIDKDFGHA